MYATKHYYFRIRLTRLLSERKRITYEVGYLLNSLRLVVMRHDDGVFIFSELIDFRYELSLVHSDKYIIVLFNLYFNIICQ